MVSIYIYVGVSLNGGTPKTPQYDHFSLENPWLLGKPPILGNPHVVIWNFERQAFRFTRVDNSNLVLLAFLLPEVPTWMSREVRING